MFVGEVPRPELSLTPRMLCAYAPDDVNSGCISQRSATPQGTWRSLDMYVRWVFPSRPRNMWHAFGKNDPGPWRLLVASVTAIAGGALLLALSRSCGTTRVATWDGRSSWCWTTGPQGRSDSLTHE